VSLAGARTSSARLVGFALAALLLANLRIPGRPSTLCPLRALTGVPCPFCGGTTAAVEVGRFDLAGALRVNPVVVLAAVMIIAMPVVIGLRTARHVGWPAAPARRTIYLALASTVMVSELWQLFRFGIL
jgi:predicted ABC-type sugar transport system permease subunit